MQRNIQKIGSKCSTEYIFMKLLLNVLLSHRIVLIKKFM